MIAAPGVIGGVQEKFNPAEVHGVFHKDVLGAIPHLLVIDIDADRFMLCKDADEGCI